MPKTNPIKWCSTRATSNGLQISHPPAFHNSSPGSSKIHVRSANFGSDEGRKTAGTLQARESVYIAHTSPDLVQTIHNTNISELGLENFPRTLHPFRVSRVHACCLQPIMLDSNAIIAVVTLLITCVPGGWFVIRVLRPRCMAWRTRRRRPKEALQPLPLHHPLPFALEPPVLHSTSHSMRMSTMHMSATYSFVCMISQSIPFPGLYDCANGCDRSPRTE